jgi:hypothetical protein
VVCRAALPFEGLCDARPGVALARFRCLGGVVVADGALVGDLGLAGELALGVADRVVGAPDAGGLGRVARRAGGDLQAPQLLARQ